MFNDLFSASLCGHCFTLFLFWLFIYESASSFYIDLDRTTVAYTLLSFRFHSGRLGSRTRALHIACLCIACLCHAFHCPSPSLTMICTVWRVFQWVANSRNVIRNIWLWSLLTPNGADRMVRRSRTISLIQSLVLGWIQGSISWMLSDVSREDKVIRWDLDWVPVNLLMGCLVVSSSRESSRAYIIDDLCETSWFLW